MLPDRVQGFKIARNPSWRSSVKTSLYYGVWFAPSTLAVAVGRPLGVALDRVAAAALRGASWVVFTVFLLVLGVAGFVVPTDDNQN